jgi:hypothetical protein
VTVLQTALKPLLPQPDVPRHDWPDQAMIDDRPAGFEIRPESHGAKSIQLRSTADEHNLRTGTVIG